MSARGALEIARDAEATNSSPQAGHPQVPVATFGPRCLPRVFPYLPSAGVVRSTALKGSSDTSRLAQRLDLRVTERVSE